MIRKIPGFMLGILFLISCVAQDVSDSLRTPIFATPTITKFHILSFTETDTPSPHSTLSIEQSATPFPEEKSLRAITDDGKWEVSLLLGYDSSVQVTSMDGKIKWVLDEKTLPDSSLGQVWNYKTSNDGNSMYFGLSSRQYETVVLNRWPPNYGLYKLNLTDGEVETILEPHRDPNGYATYGYFALSPRESQIIYSWWDEPVIILRDIATLDEQIIPLPDNYKIAGPFVWSPSEKSIVFTMWPIIWDYPTDFLIVRMDMNDKSMHYLYSDNEVNRFFVPTEWVRDDLVYLVDRREGAWQIDPLTGILEQRISDTP